MWLAIVGSPILLAHVVLAASAEVRIEGLSSCSNGLFGHGRTEPVRVSVGILGVVARPGRPDLRSDLCRGWRGRAEPATTFNFRLSTDLARVGQSGSGLPHGRWEGCEGMEADVDACVGCLAGLQGEGGK